MVSFNGSDSSLVSTTHADEIIHKTTELPSETLDITENLNKLNLEASKHDPCVSTLKYSVSDDGGHMFSTD